MSPHRRPDPRRPDPRARAWAGVAALGLVAGASAPARAGEDPAQVLRAAAASPDPAALADATQLPFLYEGRSLGRAQFIAEAVPGLFTPAVRRCLQRAPARPEGADSVLWCKPYAFYLRRIGGAWRLAEFAADPS